MLNRRVEPPFQLVLRSAQSHVHVKPHLFHQVIPAACAVFAAKAIILAQANTNRAETQGVSRVSMCINATFSSSWDCFDLI